MGLKGQRSRLKDKTTKPQLVWGSLLPNGAEGGIHRAMPKGFST